MTISNTSAGKGPGRGSWCFCAIVVAAVVVCSSCTLLLDPGSNTFGQGDPTDADQDGPEDADISDSDIDAAADADGDADAPDADADLDADRSDADDADDAGDADPNDADVDADADDVGPCPPAAVGDTLALFTFDGGSLESTSGIHRWTAGTDRGCRTMVAGQAGCGEALDFGDCGESWLTLPHRVEWGDIRSIDFWIYGRPTPGDHGVMGILSRDAWGSDAPGHFGIYTNDGHMGARIQTSDVTVAVCSEGRISSEEWHHIEVRLGWPRFELWIDGDRHTGDGAFGGTECNTDPLADTPYDISGNSEPWVLGARNWGSEIDAAEPVAGDLHAVSIDHLRFRLSR